MIHAMILDRNAAAQFAGRVVRSMIRQGCSPSIMQKHQIPQSVFHWSLGSRAFRTREVCGAAREMMNTYRDDYLRKPNSKLSGPGQGGAT
jgi:hypothetical protein